MVWRYPDTFVVGREQVRQYAKAVKANDPASIDEDAAADLGHDTLIAPLTFASIFAIMIQIDSANCVSARGRAWVTRGPR